MDIKMVYGIVLILSIGLNVVVFFKYLSKLNYAYLWAQRFSRKAVIPECSLPEVDPIFRPGKFGTTLETEVHFVGRAGIPALGAVRDSEAWILAALAKKSRRILEFGTCTGRTTYLLAKNSPPGAVVTTLTLSPKMQEAFAVEKEDAALSIKQALEESVFTDFYYTGTSVESKVKQLFMDSKQFDESEYVNSCDLIFVDGAHTYSYVLSDSRKALRMIKPGGLILWHDYFLIPGVTKGVYQALTELSSEYPLRSVRETTFAVYRKPV